MKLLTKAKTNLQAMKNIRLMSKGIYVPTGCILVNKSKDIWQVTCRKRRN
jgi:hypothetical protein